LVVFALVSWGLSRLWWRWFEGPDRFQWSRLATGTGQ
jgi:hypothetical protein